MTTQARRKTHKTLAAAVCYTQYGARAQRRREEEYCLHFREKLTRKKKAITNCKLLYASNVPAVLDYNGSQS